MVVFEKCDRKQPDNNCESDEVINEWLDHKYIIIQQNERNYQ